MTLFADCEFSDPIWHTPCLWLTDQAPAGVLDVGEFVRQVQVTKNIPQGRIRVSASMRATVWWNGVLVARGPSCSDPGRWGVMTIELGPIPAGEHTLMINVAHFHEVGGWSQMGPAPFLLVVGEGDLTGLVDSGEAWQARRCVAHRPVTDHSAGGKGMHFAAGCGEDIDAAQLATPQPWGPPRIRCREAGDRWGNLPLGARFRPDPLPLMKSATGPALTVALTDASAANVVAELGNWAAGRAPLRLPPGSVTRVVLDAGGIVNAWLACALAGGAGSLVELVAAESPWQKDGKKGDRGVVKDCLLPGHRSRFRPAPTMVRVAPLWFRSFRYLDITLTAGADYLDIQPLELESTGFPLPASLAVVASPDWARVASVSRRTAELCAHETFFDCPHYEQCQFPGDTRIQAIYHYVSMGEDRLARKAIDDFAASRHSDGMLECRWPSRRSQILPTYALEWVLMLDDFLRYRGDTAFLRNYLDTARGVMGWFDKRRRPDGLLGLIPHAPFVDWAPVFSPDGNAPQGPDGGSVIVTAVWTQASAAMARLERNAGRPEMAGYWLDLASSQRQALTEHGWHKAEQRFVSQAGSTRASIHAQVECLLAGCLPGPAGAQVLAKALASPQVDQAGTFYYRAHILAAARCTGLPGVMHDLLPRWLGALAGTGLSTWPESDGTPRSDCHAWSVAPGSEFALSVLGIRPRSQAVGCDDLELIPDLGPLTHAAGGLMTPHGPVKVEITRVGNHLDIELDSPLPVWLGERRLAAGRQRVRV